MGMNGIKPLFTAAMALVFPAAVFGQPTAFEDLLGAAGPAEFSSVPEPEALAAGAEPEAFQFLPPDNDEPGFEWPSANKSLDGEFVLIGGAATFLKASKAQSDDLADGSGRCALEAGAGYELVSRPGFEGVHAVVELRDRVPGCHFFKGYIYLPHLAATSAGGAWQLPKNVRAFLDTLAYAEGTEERYNYIFTFAVFESYADHPRVRKCSGRLCSTAAGRYQFLSKTWDGLAGSMGLADFTPPSQDKAAIELIRRNGAYNSAANSSNYDNFVRAVNKLNGTWASLPGSPYGQPTHSMANLWKYYKRALAKY
ncbi:MAG: lysozyme-like [Elusimicrobia bacterium]|nr:MAG: lysozyme-like [Elusimicrobiota bacterium]KAF0157644.1 MAG: lysozyme-like [Elusimicrobiota bacterium]